MRHPNRKVQPWMILAIATAVLALAYEGWQRFAAPAAWSEDEKVQLASLWIGDLPSLPPDPTNAVADNPYAAAFGHQLFFDARLSANGGISCSTCHQPVRRFTDGLQKGQAIGTSKRNTPSIVGGAYSPWLYWDGRRDSQWSQALSPLEDANEHGSDRWHVVRVIAEDSTYSETYTELFGELPDQANEEEVNTTFSNIGKAIAAFERLLLPTPSRFDDYVASVIAGDVAAQQDLYTDDEKVGLQLFIGKANCTQCHNGPLLTNHEFHNTGVISFPGEVPDKGRVLGVREVQSNAFNCGGAYSDDRDRNCAELEYARTGPELIGAFRTPSLRNLANTAPFMHKGQIASLIEVLRHYNEAPLAIIGHNETKPLNLRNSELRQLEAFLHTLSAPLPSDQLVRP